MKKIIISIILVLLMLLASCSVINGPDSKIIKTSTPQGDYVADERSSDEACNGMTQEIKDDNPNSKCNLIDSKRIDSSDAQEECVEGASVAGCFACTFECI